jgi:dynein intermediate chain 1
LFSDFKYWEDNADEFRELEGTLLPLWTFFTHSNLKKEKLSATGVTWSPFFPDLFAVSFGSCE